MAMDPAKKVEDEFRRLSIEIRLLEETARTLQSRLNLVNTAIADMTYAHSTLEGLEEKKEGSELLIHVGGNSYIRAKLHEPDKVIVGMGAGVSIDKTLGDAKEIIKKRFEGLGETRKSLEQRFSQVAQKINEDQAMLEELAAELRKGKASQNV